MSDMTELFSRNPMKLTLEDVDKIIEAQRAQRHLFNTQPAKKAAAASGPRLTNKEKATSSIDLDIKL